MAFITKGGSECKRADLELSRKILGKEIYIGLLSRQQPHPAQEILCSKNNGLTRQALV